MAHDLEVPEGGELIEVNGESLVGKGLTASQALITNSAKYAHYAPGLVDRRVRFNTMAACVEAATRARAAPPQTWVAANSQQLLVS